jgi:hypothetical protein
MRSLPSSTRRGSTLFAAALCAVASLLVVGSDDALAATPKPDRIQVDLIAGSPAPGGTPTAAVPTTLVEASTSGVTPAPEQVFTISVSFWAGTEPAAFSKDTALTVTSPQGAVVVLDGLATAGATSAQVRATMTTPVNQVQLTVDDVARGQGANYVAAGTTSAAQRFDVVEDLRYVPSTRGTALTAGIGGDDGTCTAPTRANPVCGLAQLPLGAVSNNVLLSVGACDTVYARCGSSDGSVVQLLADLDEEVSTPTGTVTQDLYSKTAPAALVMACDKVLCGQGSIQKQTLNYSLAGNAALQPVPPCPAKNTIGTTQEVCVDYVQSKRDNASDTFLFFLFTRDGRVSVG